ncbi:sensor histidine kinase [Oribacterium sp. oral taxon 102]|uniref:ATP-binding protein n=1 Tax=Oribacterium sp. oral taxon 102 TaxID=671214 RepID=UPI0015BD324F|nr:ATP-binding protein [Oribacterium sp. oral taxon 102]NWO20459.1 sensor histidine kinase [Oribacterium sp. oral taxon 102]
MLRFLEPVSKYLFLLLTLFYVLPCRSTRTRGLIRTVVYASLSMSGIFYLTTLPALSRISYWVFLFGMFTASLLWVLLFAPQSLRLSFPYILFLINSVITVRVFTEQLLPFHWAMLLAIPLLLLTSILMIHHSISELSFLTGSQYLILLVSPLIAFLSFSLWQQLAAAGALHNPALLLVSVCHFFMNYLFFYLVMMTVQEHQQIIRMGITAQKREMELREQRLNRGLVEQCHYIRHQFRNVCRHWRRLLEKQHYAVLEAALDKYIGEELSHNELLSTGNHQVNVLLSEKMREARVDGIQVVTRTLLHTELAVSDDDLCMILSCLIDNALEAERLEPAENREIQIDMSAAHSILQLILRNKVSTNVLERNPALYTTKKDSRFHGFGLRIVRDLIRKYDGDIRFSMDNGYFTVRVVV